MGALCLNPLFLPLRVKTYHSFGIQAEPGPLCELLSYTHKHQHTHACTPCLLNTLIALLLVSHYQFYSVSPPFYQQCVLLASWVLWDFSLWIWAFGLSALRHFTPGTSESPGESMHAQLLMVLHTKPATHNTHANWDLNAWVKKLQAHEEPSHTILCFMTRLPWCMTLCDSENTTVINHMVWIAFVVAFILYGMPHLQVMGPIHDKNNLSSPDLAAKSTVVFSEIVLGLEKKNVSL